MKLCCIVNDILNDRVIIEYIEKDIFEFVNKLNL